MGVLIELSRKYFYLFMSLLVAAIVIYGFGHTVDKNLIHAAPARPFLLYVHAAIFSAWVAFFIFQAVLIRAHKPRLHRRMGWIGGALGLAIPAMGIATAVTMARFKMLHFHSTDEVPNLIFPFFDMLAFTVPFVLAIYWRNKPEMHRRLLLIATCALTSAAFARFPFALPLPGSFYYELDILIFLGVLRDLIVLRYIHRIYLYAIPLFLSGQSIVIYTSLHDLPYWHRIGQAVLR